MSRKRYISTDISTDIKLAELSEFGVLPLLLYTWAIPHMDDWGRITGDSRQFKLLVCPALDVSSREVDEALESIYSVGLWLRYDVDGKKYICIPPEQWFKHQSYINKSKRTDDSGSNFPPPPEHGDEHSKTPQITEERRGLPKDTEDHQESPQNTVSFSSSFSPSPSISTTTTGEGKALQDVFESLSDSFFMPANMRDFFKKLMDQGYDEAFCTELLTEAYECADRGKVSIRFLESIRDRWIREGITSREQSKERKITVIGGGNSGKHGGSSYGYTEANRKAANRGAEQFIGTPGSQTGGLSTEEVRKLASSFE